MPPFDAHPLMIDLSSPPILVERIFPAATRGGCAGSTLRPVSGAPDSIGGIEATRARVETRLALRSHENGFLRVPEYLGAGRLILLGAAAARQIRERQRRAEEGARLRARRLALGLSTKQAAERLGISRRELYRMERGQKPGPADAIWRMEGGAT